MFLTYIPIVFNPYFCVDSPFFSPSPFLFLLFLFDALATDSADAKGALDAKGNNLEDDGEADDGKEGKEEAGVGMDVSHHH
jgi:hypothetical protein